MSKPQDTTAFKGPILESTEIRALLTAHLAGQRPEVEQDDGRDIVQEALDSFRSGEDRWDVSGILDEEEGDFCDSIEALGREYERFEIEIYQVGPIYRIRANEFDDIKWFGSEQEAIDHAREEFAPYIEALEESEDEDWDDLDDE